ncbi:YibE/F family protein [Desulfocurvibacter africanus]|uniref:YibE/F family protein n=1 Tax=Desulfocurvibacter africanus subsp. africanus str. Walvis Bay TaxID=690850 RepID=F3YX00_DESAF|nr:YibE/F family protein [Desulfocurvibacter africanus]EGJ49388.1 YibE/F family protein [Desulfocurvibacter africanus subsp. africanus str. Walvis Bay]
MLFPKADRKRDMCLALAFLTLTTVMLLLPSGFEGRQQGPSERCRGEVLTVDNSHMQQFGIVKAGFQTVDLRLLGGPHVGAIVEAHNELLGKMDMDKVFQVGDTALVVLSLSEDGAIVRAVAQDHYRLDTELLLLGLFALLLVAFGGWTGLKALLSFLFAAVSIWKLLIPALLLGHDPVLVSLGLTTLLTAVIIFLVAGITRMGLAAFLGAFLGIATSCVLAFLFTAKLKVHGAVMPFSETLLYSGFGHLNLTRIYIAAVFLAASGAVMDLAIDVAASQNELARRRPNLTRREIFASGLTVGRAVVGTMTTTLLFAYSGGYITLLMAFMAQGIPLENIFNLVFVSAEVLKTLVGSFGLVAVAPFTALAGALLHARQTPHLRSVEVVSHNI